MDAGAESYAQLSLPIVGFQLSTLPTTRVSARSTVSILSENSKLVLQASSLASLEGPDRSNIFRFVS
jgi:hypothetical protein